MAIKRLPQGRAPGAPKSQSNIYGRTKEADERSGFRNDNLFKKTCTPEKLYWDDKADKKTDTVMTFRLLPKFNEGGYFPARDFNEVNQPYLTGWLEKFYYFKIPGTDKKSGTGFIVFDPEDPELVMNRAKWDNPPAKLLDAITKAGKANKGMPYWGHLVSQSNRSRIDWPTWNFFAYALIYGRGPKERHEIPKGLTATDTKPIVLHMGSQVGEGIRQMAMFAAPGCEDIHEGTIPEDIPFDECFVMPDPVDLAGGILFRTYMIKGKNPCKDERKPRPDGKPTPWFMDVIREDDKKGAALGYEVYARKSAVLHGDNREDVDIKAKPAVPEKYWESLAKRHEAPIRDHLVFPDHATQIRLMIEGIKQPNGVDYAGDLFRHAYEEFPEWLDIVEDALSGVETRTKTFDAGSRDDRRATRQGELNRGRPTDTTPQDDDDDDTQVEGTEEEEDETEDPRLIARRPASRGRAPIPEEEPDEDEDEEGSGGRDSEVEEDDEDEQPVARRSPVAPASAPARRQDEAEDNGDEDLDEKVNVARPVSRDGGKLTRAAVTEPDDDDSEPPAPKTQPTTAAARTPQQRMAELKAAKIKAQAQD